MNRWSTTGRSARKFVRQSATALLLCVGLATPGLAIDRSWNTGNGNWTTAGNWTPFGVPANSDTIRIGDQPGVENSTVMLMPPGSGYGGLEITDGMTLDTNGAELVSFGHAWLFGEGSRLIVRPAPGANEYDFQGELDLSYGTFLELHDGVAVRLFGDMFSSGTIAGRGMILVSSVFPFTSGGIIQPGANGGLVLQHGLAGDGQFDLDALGSGRMYLDTSFSELEVVAHSLYDAFSGTLKMAPGALLTMNLTEDWMMDSPAEVEILGTNNPAAASLIAGSPLVFNGNLDVNSFEAHLRVLADMTFQENAVVIIGFTDWVELDGATTIEGGQFTLSNSGVLDFDGPTTVHGGSFFTISNDAADGTVDFNGATTWNGTVDIDGVARQLGNAFVNGPTVIDADVFDMDGNGSTTWTIWESLQINADSVQSNAANMFEGTATVANGTIGQLEINLAPEYPSFTMAGEMNWVGHPALFATRYAGVPLELLGQLHVSGHVATSAALEATGGTLDIDGANAILRLDDGGIISSGCTVSGAGELHNTGLRTLLLNGAHLNGVGVVNHGTLEIEPVAEVDRFTSAAGALWQVSLGGYDAGIDYDHLIVSGEAALSGSIAVDFEEGEDPFRPQAGDEFEIMTATQINGTFDAEPLTFADGFRYEWAIEYGDGAVRLILETVVDLSLCDEIKDCADIDLNNIRDDNCVFWACEAGICVDSAIVFADMGGQFGECPVDGTADGNDRFHALNCFANTDPAGAPGDPYPCEVASPNAYNVDAGGVFGNCAPDGVCDGNDAFHALNAFAGFSDCACPLDGGPAPDMPGAVDVVDEVIVELVPRTVRVQPGATVDVDVYIVDGVRDLRGYQLHFVASPGLTLVDLSVALRKDHVFDDMAFWDAYNVSTDQLLIGLDSAGVHSESGRVYLATATFAVGKTDGPLMVDLLHDATTPHHRTFLFPTAARGKIDIVETRPAVLDVLRSIRR